MDGKDQDSDSGWYSQHLSSELLGAASQGDVFFLEMQEGRKGEQRNHV